MPTERTAPYRLPLVGTLANRDGTVDQDMRYVNVFIEENGIRDDGQPRYHVIKRPGLSTANGYDLSTTEQGRGMIGWKGDLYSVVGPDLYKNGSILTTDLFTTTQGRVSMEHYVGTNEYLMVQDEKQLYYIDGTSSTEITQIQDVTNSTAISTTNVEMTAGIGCIDQYVIIGIAGTQGYAHCQPDAVTDWNNGLNVGEAIMYSDNNAAVVRHYNYLAVFGEYSLEMFWDEANTLGSAFTRVEGAAYAFGCAAPYTVVSMENELFWVGQTFDSGLSVYKTEGLSPKKISTVAVQKLLESDSDITDAFAFKIVYYGHAWYVITLPNADKTIVYDMMNDLWYQWTSNNGGTETMFKVAGSGVKDDKMFVLGYDDGKIYEFLDTSYDDDGTGILLSVVTDIHDGQDSRRKFCHRLELLGDRDTTTNSVSVYWTDDQYVSYSSARTVDLSKRPVLVRCGSFDRRAFKITTTASRPFRMEAIDVYSTTTRGVQ